MASTTSDNTFSDDLTWEDFEYLSNLERSIRCENSNATAEEVLSFLEDEIDKLRTSKENLMPIISTSSSSSTYTIFGFTLTSEEILLFATYPSQAIMAYNASIDAVTKTGEFYDGGGWLDNADAFRHAYWNALMEKRISKNVYINIGTYDIPYYTVIQVDFAKLFADAHEHGKTNIDVEMDLANNAIGRSDGANFSYLEESQLANKIMERVSYGHYWKIINPVIENNYVSSGNLVPSDWEGLKSEVLDDVLFETTLIGSTEIRIDKINWTIVGSYTIPSTIKGRTVTQIGNSAFENQTQLSQITIPASVTSIGSNAFEDCSNLEKVVIQREIGNITSLGSDAFLGCSSLETIEVPTKRILDYLYATNWSYYSSYMHYIEPITDGLTITSVGGKSQYYLFQIVETRFYNFYHHCDNPIDITIYDDENNVTLTNTTWDDNLIFIELEEGGFYKLVIETTNSEYFNIHIDEIIETELELGVKYYETLNSYSYAYYTFTTPDAQDDISYTINSIIFGARTNMWLYNGYDNLITYDFGDINRNGAKIDYYLEPDTTYTVLLYLTSYYYYDDYTIQFYETDEEVYHLDWGGISIQYFDPFTYDYVDFIVFSSCYDLVFDETTKTITFGMIECFWDVTFDGYPNCPEEYVIGMMIGINYDSFENTLAFFSMNGFYQYQAPLPYTYSYSATVTDVSITFSSTEWASFVTQGPR